MSRNTVKGAIFGVFIGLLLIPGSVILHAWNEYRTIHRTRGLNEAAEVVVTVDDPSLVSQELDNNLVHMSGEAHTEDVLEDTKFAIRETAIHLRRKVEMYQWDESESRNDNRTTYSYHQGWHEGRINSESFHEGGYNNPQLKFKQNQISAQRVTLGAYNLNKNLLNEMDDWTSISINEAAILEALRDHNDGQFLVQGNLLYWAQNTPSPDRPEIGDTRISFEVVKPADVSIMAMQKGADLGTFKTSNGEPIEDLYYGRMTSEEFVGNLKTENTIMAWLIRLGGFVMCAIGITMVFGPAHMLVSWIPVVRDITGMMIGLVAVLVAGIISLITISVSWIAVRPLLGITLLVLTGLLIFALVSLRKSMKQEAPIVDNNMFVN